MFKFDIMNFNSQSFGLIKATIEDALRKYVANGNTVITDIHLQPNQETGELVIFNDDEEILATAVINELTGLEGDFYVVVEEILRDALKALQDADSFSQLSLLKPYSFVLIDDEKETITELLLIDDQETLLLHDGLLKGLDDELDAFLKELLED